MKKLATLCLLFAALAGAGCTGKTEKKTAPKGPVPMTHILICCRSSNEGVIRFKVGDEWITNHDYRNIDHARAILSTIQQAGINDVIIVLTNPSQWAETPASWPGCQPGENALWETETKDQITTIEQVCEELGMRFVMFIGNPAAHTLAYWNGIAERIWKSWAQKDVYRKYGYGDDRPMLVVFYMGEDFWKMYDAAPEHEKNYLAKFRIGTCQVNSPMNFTATDGWATATAPPARTTRCVSSAPTRESLRRSGNAVRCRSGRKRSCGPARRPNTAFSGRTTTPATRYSGA